jgi:hypothetical protein
VLYIRVLPVPVLSRIVKRFAFCSGFEWFWLANMRLMCRTAHVFHSGRSQAKQIHLLPSKTCANTESFVNKQWQATGLKNESRLQATNLVVIYDLSCNRTLAVPDDRQQSQAEPSLAVWRIGRSFCVVGLDYQGHSLVVYVMWKLIKFSPQQARFNSSFNIDNSRQMSNFIQILCRTVTV